MTSGAAGLEAAPPASALRRSRTRLVEFLAVGGVTLLLFPLAWWLRRAFGAADAELAVGFVTFHAAYVINDPHFSVTYLLFYEDARGRAFGDRFGTAQRLRYLLAGFVAPAVLALCAAYAIVARSAPALGVLVQLMFLLVGWHYVKQGFGVLSVLCARRGAPVHSRERRALLLHCYAAWAYAWANPSTPAGDFQEKGVVYHAIAHPRSVELAAGAGLVASIIVLAWVLFSSWRRDRRSIPLGPFTVFLVTVWSWSIYSAVNPIVQYLIPALHSVQYLYFVGLLKKNTLRAAAGPFTPPPTSRLVLFALSALALGFVLFHAAPGVLDATFSKRRGSGDDLGPTPFFAAFFVVVNLHHYFMDAVLWRRENPGTRWLVAESRSGSA